MSESFGGTTIEEDTSTEIVTGLKSRAFKCEVTGYDSTGRVNKIKFTEKMYNGGETISEWRMNSQEWKSAKFIS